MAVFTDAFTGTSGDNLESRTGWTRVGGVAGAAQINASNQLKCASATDTAYQAPSAGTADHYGQAAILGGAGTGGMQVCVRVVDQNNFIGVRYSGTGYQLFKRIAGTFTSLGSVSAGTATLKVAASGTSIEAFLDTVSRIGPATVSDAVFSGVQTPGIVPRGTLVDPWLDDWESTQAAAGGALTGTSAATSGATGTLTGNGALSGTSAATSGATGTIANGSAASGEVSGISAATSGATATLTAIGALIGSSAIVSNATGTLIDAIGHLSGTVDATSGATGSLTDANFVPAEIVGNSDLGALWQINSDLRGAWALNSDLAARKPG